MGQAKQRGTQAERIAAAKERIDLLRPTAIICNECKGEISDIVDLNSRGLDGIDAVFGGVCPTCKSTTYAVKGQPDAVEKLMFAMADSNGDLPVVGVQPLALTPPLSASDDDADAAMTPSLQISGT